MNRTEFEWQADETENLDESAHLERRSRSSWWFILGFFLILVMGLSLTVWILDRRQRRLEESVQQDVRLNFDLWWQALQKNDRELHAHILSMVDRKWRLDQMRLFDADLILGRSFWGLSLLDETPTETEIELAPDWQQAIVSFEQAYAMPQDAARSGVVRLRHTAVFDLQDANWRQIPPGEEFWGDWAAVESDYLVVRYPTRDAELALRISRQLEVDLRDICKAGNGRQASASERCLPFKPVTLQMSTAAGSLAALNTVEGPLLTGSTFQMPAPTIIGQPVDEASFQAFYHGYTSGLLERVHMAVTVPIPLPEQVIRTLCFDHSQRGMRLYKYDPASGVWEVEMPGRSFSFLETLPGGQGLILDEISDGRQVWYSRLIILHEGTEKSLLEEAWTNVLKRVVVPEKSTSPYMLLQRFTGDPRRRTLCRPRVAIMHSGMRPNGSARLCTLVAGRRADAAPGWL